MTNESQYINSVCRAIAIIELFFKLQVKQLGVSEISKELTIHKTTAFRILKTLEYIGWLEQAENSKYQLSARKGITVCFRCQKKLEHKRSNLCRNGNIAQKI